MFTHVCDLEFPAISRNNLISSANCTLQTLQNDEPAEMELVWRSDKIKEMTYRQSEEKYGWVTTERSNFQKFYHFTYWRCYLNVWALSRYIMTSLLVYVDISDPHRDIWRTRVALSQSLLSCSQMWQKQLSDRLEYWKHNPYLIMKTQSLPFHYSYFIIIFILDCWRFKGNILSVLDKWPYNFHGRRPQLRILTQMEVNRKYHQSHG